MEGFSAGENGDLQNSQNSRDTHNDQQAKVKVQKVSDGSVSAELDWRKTFSSEAE